MNKENELVYDSNSITICRHISDVQHFRPDLTDEQAMLVLKGGRSVHRHDANVGINWDVLECHADDLFPGHDWVDSEDDEWDGSEDNAAEPFAQPRRHTCSATVCNKQFPPAPPLKMGVRF